MKQGTVVLGIDFAGPEGDEIVLALRQGDRIVCMSRSGQRPKRLDETDFGLACIALCEALFGPPKLLTFPNYPHPFGVRP